MSIYMHRVVVKRFHDGELCAGVSRRLDRVIDHASAESVVQIGKASDLGIVAVIIVGRYRVDLNQHRVALEADGVERSGSRVRCRGYCEDRRDGGGYEQRAP